MRYPLSRTALMLGLMMVLGAAGLPPVKPAHLGEIDDTGKLETASGIAWLDYSDGVDAAKGSGVPILIWIAPASCPECGAKTFDDPEVIEMLSDFVPVRATDDVAPKLSAPKGELHVMLLDHTGAPLPDLSVFADTQGALPVHEVIDLMSSGLDVVR